MKNQRFQWTVNGSVATLQGDVDEQADFNGLASELTTPEATIDLAGIRRINSLGVRSWIGFIKSLAGKRLHYRRCSPAVVELINAMRDFRGHGQIESVMLPFACEACGHLMFRELGADTARSPQALAPPPCEKCGGACVFDDVPERYLSFWKV